MLSLAGNGMVRRVRASGEPGRSQSRGALESIPFVPSLGIATSSLGMFADIMGYANAAGLEVAMPTAFMS